MKTLPYLLVCAVLLTAAPLLATDTLPNPERKPTSSGWVSAPDASFNARTYQDHKGDLIVQVNNRSLRGLTIQLQTLRGEEVAYVPVPKYQSSFGARLDISELTDGDYRIIVSTDNERIVKIVNLTISASTPGRVTMASVMPVAEH